MELIVFWLTIRELEIFRRKIFYRDVTYGSLCKFYTVEANKGNLVSE